MAILPATQAPQKMATYLSILGVKKCCSISYLLFFIFPNLSPRAEHGFLYLPETAFLYYDNILK